MTWDVCWEQQLLMCWHSPLAGLVWGGHFWHCRTQLLRGVLETPWNDELGMLHWNNKQHFLLCSQLSPGSSALTPAGGTEAQEVIPVQAQSEFLI